MTASRFQNMNVKIVKTHKIRPGGESIEEILDKYITDLKENSIVAIASKIISICQGRVVKNTTVSDKNKIIEKEADLFIPPDPNSQYDFYLTIKNNILIPNSGVDESNADGNLILWPENPQQTANKIRAHLIKKFNLKNVGVLIVDSKTTPLRSGVTGVSLAHSGFLALNDYIGTPDIFGRKLEVTKVNIADALAAAAVLQMGEGAEQTPLAIIDDLQFVSFQNQNPTREELEEFKISINNDIYGPILKSVQWSTK